MSKLFKVGDICIGQNFVTNVSRNGMEVKAFAATMQRISAVVCI